MQGNDFDKYAARYRELLHESIRISGYDPSFFAERKIREVFCDLLRSGRDTRRQKFLDYGCGAGLSLPFIARCFPDATIYAADSSREMIEAAKEANRNVPRVFFAHSDGLTVPFTDDFDVIFVSGVMHHVPPESRLSLLKQFHDRLAREGALFIFEHNPLNPFTRRIVRSCVFDRDASLIPSLRLGRLLEQAGFRQPRRRFIHFFPRMLRFLNPLEKWLCGVPLGAQYYFFAEKD